MEERSDMADQLIEAWKAEAEKQSQLWRDAGVDALKQEVQAKQVRMQPSPSMGASTAADSAHHNKYK